MSATRFLKSTDRPLAKAYGLALLDLDGVVYRGKEAVGYASGSIRAAEAFGMRVEYTTNNSSRYQSVVADQLKGFGLDVEPWQVITSAVVAARMTAREVPAGAAVLVIGADHLRDEVAKQGLRVVDSSDNHPAAVLQGWFPGINWQVLAEAAYAVEAGATYLVTNRDLSLPREKGPTPGCGTFINAVVATTGVEPVVSAGKPEAYMYDEARLLNASGGGDPVPKGQCLAIGDRLDTDIEAGNRGGYDSLAVLTGVTNPRELMLAPAHLRPTYVARDLRALLKPARAPERTEDGGWACGGAVARGRRRAARDRGRRRRHRRSQSRSGRRLGGRGQRPRHRRHGAAGVRRAMSGATDRTDATDAPAGARPPLEKRYPGLATLSACDDEGKAKVLRDVLDGLRRELDEEQA